MRIYTYNTENARIVAISSPTSLRNARRLADQANRWNRAASRPLRDVVLPAR